MSLQNFLALSSAEVLLGARWHGDLGILAAIYFRPVGTVLAVSLRNVPPVDCCARLCSESNLLLIGRSRIPPTRMILRKLSTEEFVTI